MDTIIVLRRPPYIGRMERDPGPYPLCAESRDLAAQGAGTGAHMRLAKVVVPAVALLLAAPVSAGAQGATQPLQTPHFTSQFLAGWTLKHRTNPGFNIYELATPGTKIDSHAVPTPGGIGITVVVFSTRAFRKTFHRPVPKGTGLVRLVAGIPRPAKKVRITSAARPYRLDGGRGGAIAFRYTYKGVQNVQRDVAAHKGKWIVTIELDCRPDLEPQGRAAMNTVLGAFNWR